MISAHSAQFGDGPGPLRKPRFLTMGDHAFTLEFGDSVDPVINDHVLSLDRALLRADLRGIIETIPTYRSLTVIFDPLRVTRDAVMAAVRGVLDDMDESDASPAPRQWVVPVVYGGTLGFDLPMVSTLLDLPEEEIVERHAQATYRVYMIGFNPGFPYLGGLDPVLQISRRATVTPRVEAGSVIIGGMQTAVCSVPTPTGWYVIGRTPVRPFDMQRGAGAFLFRAGDMLRFEPIGQGEFDSLSAAAARGDVVARELSA